MENVARKFASAVKKFTPAARRLYRPSLRLRDLCIIRHEPRKYIEFLQQKVSNFVKLNTIISL